MIYYFPSLYEDELLTSSISRLYEHSGYTSEITFTNTIFNRGLDSKDYLFYNVYSKDFYTFIKEKYSWKKIICNNTLVYYYSMFMPLDKRKEALRRAINNEVAITHYLNIPSNNGIHNHLKICPLCCKDSFENNREYYLNRFFQIGEINYCPIHNCKLINLKREIYKGHNNVFINQNDFINSIVNLIEYTDENNIELNLTKYIYKVFKIEPNYHNKVLIGDYLSSKIEFTKYMVSQRGEQRDLTKLFNDLSKFYKDLSSFNLTVSRLANIFRNNYVNVWNVLLIAFYLKIEPEDLINRKLPKYKQYELYDMKVISMFKKGMSIHSIYKKLDANKDVIKKIINCNNIY